MKVVLLAVIFALVLPTLAFGEDTCADPQNKEMSNRCANTVAAVTPTKIQSATSLDELGFDVVVTLSKKAAAELMKESGNIIVFASYYGDPKKNAEKHVNEVGLINVASAEERVKIEAAGGHAYISGVKVNAASLDWVSGPVKVNVNVASENSRSSQNMLDCDFIDGPVAHVKEQAPVKLHCYLIEENHPDTSLRP